MKEYKVSELDFPQLDMAVAMAQGLRWEMDDYMGNRMVFVFPGPSAKRSNMYSPSCWWSDGGRIIEKAGIALRRVNWTWTATVWAHAANTETAFDADGKTPLIAAMRAFVCSKLGPVVELP